MSAFCYSTCVYNLHFDTLMSHSSRQNQQFEIHFVKCKTKKIIVIVTGTRLTQPPHHNKGCIILCSVFIQCLYCIDGLLLALGSMKSKKNHRNQ